MMYGKMMISAIVALVCSTGMAMAQEQVAPKGMGHLRVLNPNKEVNVGLMKVDSIAEGSLLITNEGKAPFVIESIFTSCNCTVPEYTHEPVAPDDTVKVNVRFNARGRVPGEFRKMMRIRSTADNHFEVAFVVGKVARPIRKE